MPERDVVEAQEAEIEKAIQRRNVITVVVLLAISLISWKMLTTSALRGSGKLATQDRDVAAFQSVDSRGSFDVIVKQGPHQPVRIEGDDNLLAFVGARSESGVLVLDQKAPFKTTRPITITVSMPEVHGLALAGSGNLRSEGSLKCADIALRTMGSGDLSVAGAFVAVQANLQGSGNIAIKGDAAKLQAELMGSGNLDAKDLHVAGPCDASILGSGSCLVWVDGALKTSLQGAGSLRYRGTPHPLDSKILGSGTVSKLD